MVGIAIMISGLYFKNDALFYIGCGVVAFTFCAKVIIAAVKTIMES